MTVAELIALLREQDPMLEAHIILPAGVIPMVPEGAVLEIINVRSAIPHTGRRQVQIVTAE
jgi:hypothetical protein